MQGDGLSAVLQCLFSCHFQAAAARHLHPQEKDAFNIIFIGVGRAICSNQQFCTVKIGGAHRYQLDLAGPLGQLGRFALLCGENGCLVVGGCLPLFKSNGTRGAFRQAAAKTVTVIFTGKSGLSVYYVDRTLMTGSGAGTAAVAFLSVNFDDFSYPSCTFLLIFSTVS